MNNSGASRGRSQGRQANSEGLIVALATTDDQFVELICLLELAGY